MSFCDLREFEGLMKQMQEKVQKTSNNVFNIFKEQKDCWIDDSFSILIENNKLCVFKNVKVKFNNISNIEEFIKEKLKG